MNPNSVAGAVFPFPVELFTVRANDWVAVFFGEDESATWTVKLNCPVCDVVPESMPLLCRVMLVGNVPDESDHVYGVVPPEACSVLEYAVPAVAADNDVVVTVTLVP